MLKTLKLWLKRRQAQKLWQEKERQLAYSLLGEYKAARVIAAKMGEEDKANIAALMTDEKYISLRKLETNICAQWIQQCMHDNGEKVQIKKGGVMMYTTIQKAVENTFKQRMQNEAEEKQIDNVLKDFGW